MDSFLDDMMNLHQQKQIDAEFEALMASEQGRNSGASLLEGPQDYQPINPQLASMSRGGTPGLVVPVATDMGVPRTFNPHKTGGTISVEDNITKQKLVMSPGILTKEESAAAYAQVQAACHARGITDPADIAMYALPWRAHVIREKQARLANTPPLVTAQPIQVLPRAPGLMPLGFPQVNPTIPVAPMPVAPVSVAPVIPPVASGPALPVAAVVTTPAPPTPVEAVPALLTVMVTLEGVGTFKTSWHMVMEDKERRTLSLGFDERYLATTWEPPVNYDKLIQMQGEGWAYNVLCTSMRTRVGHTQVFLFLIR